MPLTLYDENGNYVWDTDSVGGGVFADIRTFQAADTGTYTYPSFAGRQAFLVNLNNWNSSADINVTVDTGLGYPRLTVSTAATARKVALLVK